MHAGTGLKPRGQETWDEAPGINGPESIQNGTSFDWQRSVSPLENSFVALHESYDDT